VTEYIKLLRIGIIFNKLLWKKVCLGVIILESCDEINEFIAFKSRTVSKKRGYTPICPILLSQRPRPSLPCLTWLQILSISKQSVPPHIYHFLFIFSDWTLANMRPSIVNFFLPYLCLLIVLVSFASADLENVEEPQPKRANNALLSRYGRALLSRYGKRSGNSVNPPPFVGEYRLTPDYQEGKFNSKNCGVLLI
jgi:hypothetical protein